MQHKYWVTKQQVCKKLGKKDDEFVVSSDAELDAKLELFKSIRSSCHNLQRIVNKYDEKIYSEYSFQHNYCIFHQKINDYLPIFMQNLTNS